MTGRTSVRRRLLACHLAAAALVLAAAAAGAWGQDRPRTADLVPGDAFLTVTLREGQSRLNALRESRVFKSYLQSPAFAALEQQSKYLQARGGLYMFAGIAGMDPWNLAGQILGEELTIGIGPRGGTAPPPTATRAGDPTRPPDSSLQPVAPRDADEPAVQSADAADVAPRGQRGAPGAGSDKPYVLAVFRPADAQAARRIVSAALTMTGALLDGQPVEGRWRDVDGVRVSSLNPEAFVAELDGFVAFCNHRETLERVIRGRAARAESLAAQPLYRRAAEAVPRGAAAWAYVALEPLRRAAGEDFRRKLDNALAAMLLGGWIDAVRSSEAVVAWAEASEEGVSVSGRLIGARLDEPRLKPFFVRDMDARDWSRLALPGLIGEAGLARDWAGLWDVREELMNADGMRGLLNFANTLTTLMGSLDFSGELLPGLRPTLHLVAARQRFEGDPPTPELPGFALLLHMKDPGKLAPRLENAALMALSILNVDRGQKMQPQYQMELAEHRGTRMLTAKFAEQTEPGPRGTRFNFEPSVAAVGDRFVICTSRRMLEDLIDALPGLPQVDAGAAARAVDALRIDLGALRDVFEANRELFITNRMLEGDLEREPAARQVGMVLDAARMLKDFSVRLEAGQDEVTFAARLGLRAIE